VNKDNEEEEEEEEEEEKATWCSGGLAVEDDVQWRRPVLVVGRGKRRICRG
jgi:hypothetical protein